MLPKKLLPKMFRTETDAVPVNDVDDNHHTSAVVAIQGGTSSTSTELVEGFSTEITHPAENNEIADHQTNNNLFVNNTRGQVLMQFQNISGLHMGDVFNINKNGPTGAQTPAAAAAADVKKIRRTRTIESMMQCNDGVDTKFLTTVAANLGEGWQFVMRDLGISDAEIQQNYMSNYVYGIKEVIYTLLLDWKRSSEENQATVGRLTKVLWKNEHRECVNKAKEIWRSDKN